MNADESTFGLMSACYAYLLIPEQQSSCGRASLRPNTCRDFNRLSASETPPTGAFIAQRSIAEINVLATRVGSLRQRVIRNQSLADEFVERKVAVAALKSFGAHAAQPLRVAGER